MTVFQAISAYLSYNSPKNMSDDLPHFIHPYIGSKLKFDKYFPTSLSSAADSYPLRRSQSRRSPQSWYSSINLTNYYSLAIKQDPSQDRKCGGQI